MTHFRGIKEDNAVSCQLQSTVRTSGVIIIITEQRANRLLKCIYKFAVNKNELFIQENNLGCLRTLTPFSNDTTTSSSREYIEGNPSQTTYYTKFSLIVVMVSATDGQGAMKRCYRRTFLAWGRGKGMGRGRGHRILFTQTPGGRGGISQGKVRANIPCTTRFSSFNEIISLYNHN